MRRIYLVWCVAVFGIVGTVYGSYLLIYHFNRDSGLNIPSLILLIFGSIALILFLILYIPFLIKQKKKKNGTILSMEEHDIEEEDAEPIVEEEKPAVTSKAEPRQEKEEYVPNTNNTYRSSSSYSVSTIYVKQVGCGPLLRIEGTRVIDMRTNTYYRIENNMVMQEGYGPVFEIRGNQIKDAFGGYLYEVSGSNINKAFGGFYASISGNYITLYDLSEKYEMTDSLSRRQLLVVAALLFEKY